MKLLFMLMALWESKHHSWKKIPEALCGGEYLLPVGWINVQLSRVSAGTAIGCLGMVNSLGWVNGVSAGDCVFSI